MSRAIHGLMGLLLLLIAASCATEKPVSRKNFYKSYQQDAPIRLHTALRKSEDSLHIRLLFSENPENVSRNTAVFRARYRLELRKYADYHTKKPYSEDTIPLTRLRQKYKGVFTLDLEGPNRKQNRVYLFRLTDRKTGWYTTTERYVENSRQRNDQQLFFGCSRYGNPLVFPFLQTGDTVCLRSSQQAKGPFYVLYYGNPFAPALVPMAVSEVKNQPDIHPLDSQQIALGQTFVPRKAGLYLFIEKGQKSGKSLLVTDTKFPLTTTPDQLAKSLTYLTSMEERSNFSLAENKKKELDDFWIRVAGNQNYARKVIRAYYTKAELANLFFTSYKKGWKTDRGMVYMVYGAPDAVYRSQDQEIWSYTQSDNQENVQFTFVRKPTIFTYENFELKRSNDYGKKWYDRVEEWREGVIK